MIRVVKIVLIFLAIVFIAIQFYQPVKNLGDENQNLILNTEKMPEKIQQILKNSCLDCHSNHTNYLWYHKISPVSWLINNHITKGKKELNLSNWGQLDDFKKIAKLEDIKQEIERGTMPLKSYTFIHQKAKLTAESKAELLRWIDSRSSEILNSSVK